MSYCWPARRVKLRKGEVFQVKLPLSLAKGMAGLEYRSVCDGWAKIRNLRLPSAFIRFRIWKSEIKVFVATTLMKVPGSKPGVRKVVLLIPAELSKMIADWAGLAAPAV